MIQYLIPTAFAASAAAADGSASIPQGVGGIFGFITGHFFGWVGGLIILVISYLLAKTASGKAREYILRSKGEEAPENVLILVERMSRISVLAIGIVIAGSINGIQLGTVIGAISLGIGFAIKDIIGNFISSVVMLAQNRVRIGDFIKVGDIIGTIVNIDTRVTVLQAIDGTQVVIPNQAMLNQTLISYTTNPYRRIDLIVGVDYKSDLAIVTSLIKAVMAKDQDIVKKPEASVVIDDFGESSITLHVYFWIESTRNWLAIKSNLAHRIKKAFDEVGVSIPFPIRTLKLDENDRAFLQTMDSLKKGYVPPISKPRTKEELKIAASETEQEAVIPYDIYASEIKSIKELEPVPAPVPPPSSLQPQQKEPDPASPPAKHL